jgi:hypothetical protein
MRQTLIKALLTLTFMICGLESVAQSTPTENRWDNLIKAISAVESKGNPRAVSGKHVGILQISPIVVEDCNRINKLKKNKKRFTYGDRYSVEKSIEMFNIIQDFYNPSHDREKAMRLWNGGSNYSVRSTNGYVSKVNKELNKIEKVSER